MFNVQKLIDSHVINHKSTWMVQKCFASPTKNKGSNGQKLNGYQAQLCYLPITGSKVSYIGK